jgi:hypothetical protein
MWAVYAGGLSTDGDSVMWAAEFPAPAAMAMALRTPPIRAAIIASGRWSVVMTPPEVLL